MTAFLKNMDVSDDVGGPEISEGGRSWPTPTTGPPGTSSAATATRNGGFRANTGARDRPAPAPAINP